MLRDFWPFAPVLVLIASSSFGLLQTEANVVGSSDIVRKNALSGPSSENGGDLYIADRRNKNENHSGEGKKSLRQRKTSGKTTSPRTEQKIRVETVPPPIAEGSQLEVLEEELPPSTASSTSLAQLQVRKLRKELSGDVAQAKNSKKADSGRALWDVLPHSSSSSTPATTLSVDFEDMFHNPQTIEELIEQASSSEFVDHLMENENQNGILKLALAAEIQRVRHRERRKRDRGANALTPSVWYDATSSRTPERVLNLLRERPAARETGATLAQVVGKADLEAMTEQASAGGATAVEEVCDQPELWLAYAAKIGDLEVVALLVSGMSSLAIKKEDLLDAVLIAVDAKNLAIAEFLDQVLRDRDDFLRGKQTLDEYVAAIDGAARDPARLAQSRTQLSAQTKQVRETDLVWLSQEAVSHFCPVQLAMIRAANSHEEGDYKKLRKLLESQKPKVIQYLEEVRQEWNVVHIPLHSQSFCPGVLEENDPALVVPEEERSFGEGVNARHLTIVRAVLEKMLLDVARGEYATYVITSKTEDKEQQVEMIIDLDATRSGNRLPAGEYLTEAKLAHNVSAVGLVDMGAPARYGADPLVYQPSVLEQEHCRPVLGGLNDPQDSMVDLAGHDFTHDEAHSFCAARCDALNSAAIGNSTQVDSYPHAVQPACAAFTLEELFPSEQAESFLQMKGCCDEDAGKSRKNTATTTPRPQIAYRCGFCQKTERMPLPNTIETPAGIQKVKYTTYTRSVLPGLQLLSPRFSEVFLTLHGLREEIKNAGKEDAEDEEDDDRALSAQNVAAIRAWMDELPWDGHWQEIPSRAGSLALRGGRTRVQYHGPGIANVAMQYGTIPDALGAVMELLLFTLPERRFLDDRAAASMLEMASPRKSESDNPSLDMTNLMGWMQRPKFVHASAPVSWQVLSDSGDGCRDAGAVHSASSDVIAQPVDGIRALTSTQTVTDTWGGETGRHSAETELDEDDERTEDMSAQKAGDKEDKAASIAGGEPAKGAQGKGNKQDHEQKSDPYDAKKDPLALSPGSFLQTTTDNFQVGTCVRNETMENYFMPPAKQPVYFQDLQDAPLPSSRCGEHKSTGRMRYTKEEMNPRAARYGVKVRNFSPRSCELACAEDPECMYWSAGIAWDLAFSPELKELEGPAPTEPEGSVEDDAAVEPEEPVGGEEVVLEEDAADDETGSSSSSSFLNKKTSSKSLLSRVLQRTRARKSGDWWNDNSQNAATTRSSSNWWESTGDALQSQGLSVADEQLGRATGLANDAVGVNTVKPHQPTTNAPPIRSEAESVHEQGDHQTQGPARRPEELTTTDSPTSTADTTAQPPIGSPEMGTTKAPLVTAAPPGPTTKDPSRGNRRPTNPTMEQSPAIGSPSSHGLHELHTAMNLHRLEERASLLCLLAAEKGDIVLQEGYGGEFSPDPLKKQSEVAAPANPVEQALQRDFSDWEYGECDRFPAPPQLPEVKEGQTPTLGDPECPCSTGAIVCIVICVVLILAGIIGSFFVVECMKDQKRREAEEKERQRQRELLEKTGLSQQQVQQTMVQIEEAAANPEKVHEPLKILFEDDQKKLEILIPVSAAARSSAGQANNAEREEKMAISVKDLLQVMEAMQHVYTAEQFETMLKKLGYTEDFAVSVGMRLAAATAAESHIAKGDVQQNLTKRKTEQALQAGQLPGVGATAAAELAAATTSTSGRLPSAAVVRPPSIAARAPSGAVRPPSATERAPSTTVRPPSAAERASSATVRPPSVAARAPSGAAPRIPSVAGVRPPVAPEGEAAADEDVTSISEGDNEMDFMGLSDDDVIGVPPDEGDRNLLTLHFGTYEGVTYAQMRGFLTQRIAEELAAAHPDDLAEDPTGANLFLPSQLEDMNAGGDFRLSDHMQLRGSTLRAMPSGVVPVQQKRASQIPNLGGEDGPTTGARASAKSQARPSLLGMAATPQLHPMGMTEADEALHVPGSTAEEREGTVATLQQLGLQEPVAAAYADILHTTELEKELPLPADPADKAAVQRLTQEKRPSVAALAAAVDEADDIVDTYPDAAPEQVAAEVARRSSKKKSRSSAAQSPPSRKRSDVLRSEGGVPVRPPSSANDFYPNPEEGSFAPRSSNGTAGKQASLGGLSSKDFMNFAG